MLGEATGKCLPALMEYAAAKRIASIWPVFGSAALLNGGRGGYDSLAAGASTGTIAAAVTNAGR